MRTILLLGLGGSTVLGLSACAPAPVVIQAPTTPYHLSTQSQSLLNRIRQQGVQVIHVGENYTFVMLADRLFYRQQLKLRPQARQALINIATFIKRYQHLFRYPKISVSGYTDKVFAESKRKPLSQQYASVAAAVLWSQGIPYAKMRVRGYGASYAVASNRYPRGSVYNRRVEIRIS